MIGLTHPASYHVRRHLDRFEQDVLAQGGFTERLRQPRRRARE